MAGKPRKQAEIIRALPLLCLAVVYTVLLLFAFNGMEEHTKAVPLSARIGNYDEVIASIRHGLRCHAENIKVSFSYGKDIQKEITAVVGDWVEEALEETDDPTEGDYIRYQYGGYEIQCACDHPEGGRYQYTVTIVPHHYTFWEQEERLTAVLKEIEAGFGFTPSTTDYEKIRTIYSWVCANVKYDKVHKNNGYAHLRSTCYSAVIWRTAACQGYSVTLYRLLREAGVNCRILTGMAQRVDSSREFHAWNIVELEGKWYGLDATWDAGREDWRYFLRGKDGFAGHTPGKPFNYNDLASQYTISETDWLCPDNLSAPEVVFG